MNTQNTVVLSLGSNQGNRQENISQCMHWIHLEMGTVVAVSKLYETPAWGFESALFYNAAVVLHTSKSAPELLTAIQSIEKKLGRIRAKGSGYQARMIDIDIISFNQESIETPDLQIPHPQMQNRLFVLLPMNDLALNFTHPILNKNISELIAECQDQGDWSVIAKLELPQ